MLCAAWLSSAQGCGPGRAGTCCARLGSAQPRAVGQGANGVLSVRSDSLESVKSSRIKVKSLYFSVLCLDPQTVSTVLHSRFIFPTHVRDTDTYITSLSPTPPPVGTATPFHRLVQYHQPTLQRQTQRAQRAAQAHVHATKTVPPSSPSNPATPCAPLLSRTYLTHGP